MTPSIFSKIKSGEALTDEELLTAYKHFHALENLLAPLLPDYKLAWLAAVHEFNHLSSYVNARGLKHD